MPVRYAAAAALLIAGQTAYAQTTPPPLTPPQNVTPDGTIILNDVRVPLSPLMSAEAKAYVQHLLIDKPFGRPAADIKSERVRQDGIMNAFLAPMLRRYAVTKTEAKISGILVDVVEPAAGITPRNRTRVLINLHGGGFTTGARTAALVEAVPISALMGIKVVSVDYRMSPEASYPAASDDVEAVYRSLLRSYRPNDIGIYGCSAGGMLTAQTVARLASKKLPLPGAVGVFCAGLGELATGDGAALAGPLNGYVPRPNPPGRPATGVPMAYMATAATNDPLAYPLRSPDLLRRFPPTLFITGTRSFEISSALDSHNALARNGVLSQIHAWDGMFHGFLYNSDLPEAREAYDAIKRFFDEHLGAKK